MYYQETPYSGVKGVDDLLFDVLMRGVDIPNERTGTTTKALFDAKVVIKEGEFPFVTNMLASPRLAFEELMFFLRGKTNTKELEDKGVFFWSGNTSREFLDKNGLGYLKEGELGSAYSCQWRHYGGYNSEVSKIFGLAVVGGGGDQLANLLEGLKNDKYGRRHLVNLWNPLENKYGVLTPCWYSSQYVVLPNGNGNDVLHVKLNNRSLDCLFGAKFAIMQYRMFQMMLCKMFGFKLGRLSCDLSHVHIYENQYEYTEELLERSYIDPNLSSIKLNKDIESLEDLLSVEWEDWEMVYEYNKEPFETPRPNMVT